MMTIEEILKEAKASMKIEGMKMSKEIEEIVLKCSMGETTFNEEKRKIIEKYNKK